MRNLVASRKCLVFLLAAVLLTVSLHTTSYGQGRNKIYWTEVGWRTKTGKIRRAHLDGSYVKDIVTELKDPRSIALDMLRRKVYWTDEGMRKIQRANLDGSDAENIITELNNPWSIALDFPGTQVTPSIDKLTTTWGKVKVE